MKLLVLILGAEIKDRFAGLGRKAENRQHLVGLVLIELERLEEFLNFLAFPLETSEKRHFPEFFPVEVLGIDPDQERHIRAAAHRPGVNRRPFQGNLVDFLAAGDEFIDQLRLGRAFIQGKLVHGKLFEVGIENDDFGKDVQGMADGLGRHFVQVVAELLVQESDRELAVQSEGGHGLIHPGFRGSHDLGAAGRFRSHLARSASADLGRRAEHHVDPAHVRVPPLGDRALRIRLVDVFQTSVPFVLELVRLVEGRRIALGPEQGDELVLFLVGFQLFERGFFLRRDE
ncbi:MAG: hypothetical protein BWX98_02316 [Candidatus Aminicenantes bacterium ADurb.Bin147]|nr:MAG: hypothetical protein BWX98_02316 [Candidatus Aminicenantes bacterium ADurb.Bin147]